MSDFTELCYVKNLVRVVTTCYKRSETPSCIDLFLKNLCLHYIIILETGLFDLHKLIATVMKTYFQIMKAIGHRSYETLDTYEFIYIFVKETYLEDSNWKPKDLVNSILNCIDQKFPRKSVL